MNIYMKNNKLNFITNISEVDIDSVKPNSYNPNIMDEKTYKLVKDSILKDGLIGSILVREDEINEGQFIIIDGEHRWTVAKELGYKKIPITILSKNQVDSMVSTIAMNKIKGEFDPIKLAEVIKKLLSFYTIEELEDKLGYTKDEFNYLDSLLKVNINTFENKDDNIYKEKSEIKELTFDVMLDENTFDLLKNTLSQIDKNESKAFITLCKKYNG